MTKKRWSDLSPAAKTTLISVGAVDAGLRIWALIDLARRPKERLAGSKSGWAVALVAVNSAGILPAMYLCRARKPLP